MMALVGQVGRIGCLLVMVLLVCATGIETASGHRHHVNGGDNGNHHQGVASKSRILTKTDSSINQQDQNPMMTIKSLANSGSYNSIFPIRTTIGKLIEFRHFLRTPHNLKVRKAQHTNLIISNDRRKASTKKEQMAPINDIVCSIFLVSIDESSFQQGQHVPQAYRDRSDSRTRRPDSRRPLRGGQKPTSPSNDGPNGKTRSPADFLSFILYPFNMFSARKSLWQIGHTLLWNSRFYCILKRVRSYRKNGERERERETYAVQHETTGEPIRLNSSRFVLTSYLCWHRCQREDYIGVEEKKKTSRQWTKELSHHFLPNRKERSFTPLDYSVNF